MNLKPYFDERNDIARLVGEGMQPSLLNVYQSDLPKVLVVAVASSFERSIVSHIEEFFASTTQHESASIFVTKKALFRQYHQLFSWGDNTVTTFTNFFGPACTRTFKEQLAVHEWLEGAVRDFLQLGRARNELVHGDFASHPLSLTAGEVETKYESAQKFVDSIPQVIRVEPINSVQAV